jgi:hypothetical protein
MPYEKRSNDSIEVGRGKVGEDDFDALARSDRALQFEHAHVTENVGHSPPSHAHPLQPQSDVADFNRHPPSARLNVLPTGVGL